MRYVTTLCLITRKLNGQLVDNITQEAVEPSASLDAENLFGLMSKYLGVTSNLYC